MSATPVSLLERLRLHPGPADWRRLVDLYTPLIRNWLCRCDLQESDAEDLSQEVLGVLVRELPTFRHDLRTGAFRRWLRTVVVHRVRDFWRARRRRPSTGSEGLENVLTQLEDPASGLSQLWDRQHDQHVVRRLLELIRPDFEPATWEAFRLVQLEGQSTDIVAAQLGLSPNAVRIAKSRVLCRFRQEAAGLLD